MKILKLFSVVLIFLVATTAIYAEEEKDIVSLDVETAIIFALDASEALRIKDNDIAKKDSQHSEACSMLYPSVDGSVAWQKHYLYPNISSTASVRDYTFSAGVTATQIITTFGKVSAAIGAAEKGKEVTVFVREGVKNDIIYATKVMYFNAYFAKRTLDLVQESYHRASQNNDILKKRSEKGRVSKHDNIKIMADLAARVPVVNNANAEFSSAMETLKTHLDVGKGSEMEFLEGYRYDNGDIDKESLYNALDTSYPTLKALYETISLYEEAVKGKEAEYLPTVSAFVSLKHAGNSSKYYIVGDMGNYGDVGVSVSIPIFSGGKRKQQLSQARLDKENAVLSAQKMRKDLTLELEKSIIEYEELLKSIPSNEQAVHLAEETFILSQDLFASGQISVTDLNDAEFMLTNQKLKSEMTLFKVSVLRAKIEMFTGAADDYIR